MADGLIAIASAGSYAATVERLDAVLAARKIVPMLRWDHAAAAATVGLMLPPSLLIVFGDPRVGTVLMQEQATIGIDLPLKMLIWEDADGTVQVGCNDPAWVRARHGLWGGARCGGRHGDAAPRAGDDSRWHPPRMIRSLLRAFR